MSRGIDRLSDLKQFSVVNLELKVCHVTSYKSHDYQCAMSQKYERRQIVLRATEFVDTSNY